MKRGYVEKGSATAVVTGATTGIGRQYADQLARRGYNLIIVSRDQDAVDEVAREISQAYGVKVFARGMDLAREEAAREMFDYVISLGENVRVLVNNAGMFSFCDIINTPEERIRKIVLLHNMTLLLSCRLFGEYFAGNGGGWILNMSSYSLWMPFPGLALYSSSKAMIKSFSVAFAKEMREHNVYVTAVCPGGIATDLYGLTRDWQKIGLKLGALTTPAFCARRGLNALFRKEKCIVPDWWYRLFIPLCKYLLPPVQTLLRRFTMKFQK